MRSNWGPIGLLLLGGCWPVDRPWPTASVSPVSLETHLLSNGDLAITVDLPGEKYHAIVSIDGEPLYEINSGERWATYSYWGDRPFVADFIPAGPVTVGYEPLAGQRAPSGASPVNLQAEANPDWGGIRLTWQVTYPAAGQLVTHTVSRRLLNGTFSSIATVAYPYYFDRTATPGVNYEYRVEAQQGAMVKNSNTVVSYRPLGMVSNLQASRDRQDGIEVSWAGSAGATAFSVLKCQGVDGSGCALMTPKPITTAHYLDNTVPANQTFYYQVLPFGANGLAGRMSNLVAGPT